VKRNLTSTPVGLPLRDNRLVRLLWQMDPIRPRTLADYLRLARRHKLAVAAPMAIFLVASAAAIWQVPDIYESATFVIVESPQSSTTSDRPAVDVGRRLTTIRQQVMTRTGLEDLIGTFGLYPKMREHGEPTDNLVAAMRSDIAIDVTSARPDATDAFTISYRAPDPEIAREVTAALAERLIADNMQAVESQAAGEVDALRSRAGELSSQLLAMESRSPWLASLKEEGIPEAPASTERLVGPSQEAVRGRQADVANLRDQQYKLRQQIQEMERRITEQKQIVDNQKKSPIGRDGSTVGALVAKRAELQGQRETCVKTQGLTDKHPRVVALDDQIDSINRAIAEIRKQEAGAGQTPEERELATLQFDCGRLRIDLEVAERQLQRQMGLPLEQNRPVTRRPAPVVPRDAASARLSQDYVSLRQSYRDVSSRLEKARMEAEEIQSGKVDRFRVVDKANLPKKAIWPNRRLLLFISALVSLGLGIAFLVCVTFRKLTSVQDAADVEYYTGLPLLGAVPRMTTPAEERQRAKKRRLQMLIGGAPGVVATFGLSKVLVAVHLFEFMVRR